ncbi:helix-turn-helix domain-containing protein [Mucilaginibacter paludis]|uniref:Transcriptional regulator, AraC family n=1 Tax=Mucilaginibacter paludis DSM 18603 TaxID=714943 RepID=H1Y3T2_9SPHI|nr:AraC family transcriptional regulator [Mucilaginibacter paludis]EHQ30344.1 transcriptional regulator, AraC family [Mucilaginibacter paludis DSM 18603]
MKKLKQFDALLVEEYEETVFHQPSHSQNYYEIVYIFEGNGVHWLNDSGITYNSGDLFVVSPEDKHYFEIKQRTRFAIVKFTDSYFCDKQHLIPDDLLINRPETIMRNKLLKEGKLALDESARYLLNNTMCNIVASKDRKDLTSSPFIYCQVLSVFGLIKEAMAQLDIPLRSRLPDLKALTLYIHQHIYEPEKIQVKNVAANFNIAPNYFSVYFSRNFDMSYRDYINNYRIKLIEKRVMAGLTLKQIANEFGFSDESHLSHFFRKRIALSPGQYRAQKARLDQKT